MTPMRGGGLQAMLTENSVTPIDQNTLAVYMAHRGSVWLAWLGKCYFTTTLFTGLIPV